MVTKFNINDELDKFHKLRPTNLQNMETIVKLKNKYNHYLNPILN